MKTNLALNGSFRGLERRHEHWRRPGSAFRAPPRSCGINYTNSAAIARVGLNWKFR
jgi:hypothetical protein